MNYIKQVNAFYKFLPNNPLSSNAQCLYSYLLNKNSELGWIKEFSVSNMIVCGFTSLSRQALDRARNELKQKGYIDYKKGHSNQAGTYVIVCFDTHNDTQDNTHNDTQSDTQGGHTLCTLNKLKETKLNNKESKKETTPPKKNSFDEIIDSYTQNEVLRFELKEHLKTRKAKKATLTDRAIELACKSLDKLTDDENVKIEIVRQSIANGWTGFFELKTQVKQTTPVEDKKDFVARMEREMREEGII